MKQRGLLDQVGLRLSRQALRVLKERGIFVQSAVTLGHQHLAKRYVVRGLESGGAVGDLGRYVTFAQPDGRAVECLHPVEVIGVNGLHTVVVAPVLVRIEMVQNLVFCVSFVMLLAPDCLSVLVFIECRKTPDLFASRVPSSFQITDWLT